MTVKKGSVTTDNSNGIWVQGEPLELNPQAPIVAHYMVSPPMDLRPPIYTPYTPPNPIEPVKLFVTDPRISEMVVQMAQLVEEVRRLTDALEKLAARKKR